MNIKSVSRVGAIQNAAHQSAYLYGVDRQLLPPKSPVGNYVELSGPGRMETTYQYRQIEGWLGDVPATFTFLMAYRSYEYTKQIFSDYDRRMSTRGANSWIV